VTGEAATDSPKAPHCRNCGAIATQRFCPECGQETRLELPTLREFAREAMGRLVAFDGRLGRTLFALAFRPGHLTKAYLAGRRRTYVRPARLYLAMSILLLAIIRWELKPVDLANAVVVHTSEEPGGASGPKDAEGANPESFGTRNIYFMQRICTRSCF
jgi:hypothetical protein